jgi:site-specific DNA-methyltransferase (adenine-specific)
MINLYNEDCLEAMKKMDDNSYELAIVDPPYGINMDGGNIGGGVLAKQSSYEKKDWDKSPPNKEYFDELIRVSKNQIVFGANHFISKLPYDSSCWIVWNKKNGQNYFADCELAWTSFPTAVRMVEYRWHGMLQENMKNKEQRIHPTQKPVGLYTWILNNYAKEGDKILDTHLGSGSIAIACHNLGFDLDGYELDVDYYEAATKRLKEHQRQLKLF